MTSWRRGPANVARVGEGVDSNLINDIRMLRAHPWALTRSRRDLVRGTDANVAGDVGGAITSLTSDIRMSPGDLKP